MCLFLIFYLIKSKISTKYKKEKTLFDLSPIKGVIKTDIPAGVSMSMKMLPLMENCSLLKKEKKDKKALVPPALLPDAGLAQVGPRALLLSILVAQPGVGLVPWSLTRTAVICPKGSSICSCRDLQGQRRWVGRARGRELGRPCVAGAERGGPGAGAGSRDVCVLLLLAPVLLLDVLIHVTNINTISVSLPTGRGSNARDEGGFSCVGISPKCTDQP